jgi:hypothetical protein
MIKTVALIPDVQCSAITYTHTPLHTHKHMQKSRIDYCITIKNENLQFYRYTGTDPVPSKLSMDPKYDRV